ncbi:methylated-DNA--[protein]-cysteine S-methyltransferase [uncultured Kordia sp.]|uniref:bifunctional transcriptional activator/DNA repair enzyme AdaA n=1 Tax=uncultured Kordia sp. TaxID=507699 RepID=UPI0026016B1C|nr:methylated-DNA--[protein]-cysteine S-methyltransferase [uncultured Kordia sp.]
MLITETEKIHEYYQALIERNESFVGIFFVGVKTTSVFCIATCRARKPKLKNVEFYTSFKEALDNGYRPCKICKPTENANEAPKEVETAIQLVKENPKEKITDDQLRERNISPEKVRRWFNKNYRMTFQAYQRMYRINNAFLELKKGKNATHTAFDTGYESLSGFGYTYKKLIGKSPQKSIDKTIILIHRFTTPLGPMFVCATDKGICLLEFIDKEMLETAFKELQRLLNANIIIGENEHIQQAKKELKAYFEGSLTNFNVQIEMPGTDFQKETWKALQTIQYGQTVSYQEQAQKINNPKAVRAVAKANSCNRISIIIPCHRVIGKKGKLTGYNGGVERKRWLLAHEEKHVNSL